MKRMLVASTVLALALGACGGGGRPSEDDIADALKGDDSFSGLGEIPDDAADCLAKALHDSDVSDDLLQAIVDGDEDYDPSKDDEKALASLVNEDFAKCVGAG